MLLPIASHTVPRDLAAMLVCHPHEVKEIVPITGLAGKHAEEGATYRVTFRNGDRTKARSRPSHKDAGDVSRILDRLPPDRFPRMLAFEPRVSLEQWFDGDLLTDPATTEERLLDSGRLLGLIHQTSSPEQSTEQDWRSTSDCTRQLESKLNRLVALRVIDRRSATKVWENATAERPAYARYGLAHRDFCGENLLVSQGKVCCIDNVTFATLALDEDLARTWYRWPMADTKWRLFLQGYARTRDVEPFLRSGLFWKANVLTGSILMRLRCGLPAQAQIPLNRLLVTFRLVNSVGDESAKQTI